MSADAKRSIGTKRWLKLFPAAALGIALGCGWPDTARAALYASGTTSQQMLDFGTQLKGRTLHMRVHSPIITGGMSNQSATFLNSEYAITSYHNIVNLIPNYTLIEISDGTNYLSNRGNTVTVAEIKVHPTEDLALLRFSQPSRPVDFYGQAVPDQVIVPVAPGDMVIAGGFGQWGTPATGLLARDGGLRGWDGRVGSIVTDPSQQHYTFGYSNNGTRRNARGASGDSGGGTFAVNTDGSGEMVIGGLVGISDSGSTGIDETGLTWFMNLFFLKSWINENAKVTIPPPNDPELAIVSSPGVGMTVSWDGNAAGWTLQRSGDLLNWLNEGSAIQGSGSQVFSGNERSLFFRLHNP